MVAQAVTSPDTVTLITNIAVFLAAAGTTVAAIWSAVKKIKTVLPQDAATTKSVVGGMIMDHTTLLMWSESNRTVSEKLDEAMAVIRENTRETVELRFVMTQVKDKL